MTAGVPTRVDVYLESFTAETTTQEQRQGANELKVGDKLAVRTGEPAEMSDRGSSEVLLLVLNKEGGQVGFVRQSLLQEKLFCPPPFSATVRSIKRDKGTSDVVQVQVRVTEGGPALPPPPPEKHDGEEEEGSWALSKAQLDTLASSEEIQQLLRDERLRSVIARIDGADNRHKELLAQLEKDPAFMAVCNQMIDTMAPSEEEPQ